MKIFYWFIIVKVFAIIVLVIYFSTLNSSPKPEQYVINNLVNLTVTPSKYRILLWTKYFGGNAWTKQNLRQLKCEYNNCELTADRSLLYASDALLFHWWDFSVQDMPRHHYTGQKWVLFNWEAVHTSPVAKIRPIADRIDWLMSYQMDADIYAPYGEIKPCDTQWNNEDLFDHKTRNVSWIVSNCDTWSKREDYVEELKKYIDVDVFGACGEHKCSRDDDKCYKDIANRYKFYLSMENSLCKDYVTEKLFRTLEYDIIPIVYGYRDYKNTLPNNSVIDIMDFKSPKALGEYLKVVSKDKHKYNSHMNWRKTHCSERTHYKYLCRLCKKLNDNYKNRNDISNNSRLLTDLWNVTKQCYAPGNFSNILS